MNWGFYVWAVTHGYVLAASLGYFIAPIFYVGAGVLILREPLTRSRGWATGIAGVALLPLVIGSGYATVLIAVVLAVSIVAYSLLRKRGALMAIPALFVESVVLTPLALLYLWISHGSGVVCSECSDRQAALLVTSGIVTLVPLVFFGVAVRGLPLSTIGFLQYISPCLQLALGLWFFGEQMDMGRAVTFGLVWIAIIVNLLGDRGQAPPGNRQPQKIE
jgi:chloramphenicol-sensitive protein RarD